MFVAAMAMTFAACGNSTNANTECVDSDSVCCAEACEEVVEVVDSAAEVVDSVVAEVVEAL